MPDNFFAMLTDGTTRKIQLLQNIEPNIRDVFINRGEALLNDRELVDFEETIEIAEDEISFISFVLPETITEVAANPIGIELLDLQNDPIKALFWFEDNVYYFQNFDNRRLLQNKNVIFYSNQLYNRLTENAFVVENMVNAVYRNGHFLFTSYANANKIFSLAEYYREATNEELATFGAHQRIAMEDFAWFQETANTVMRKQVSMLQDSGVLDILQPRTVRNKASEFNLDIHLNRRNQVVFPRDKKQCREILLFLNEQYFLGIHSGNRYKTNSKRRISNPSGHS